MRNTRPGLGTPTLESPCPFCCGASLLLSRGGIHDPACPTVQWFPVLPVTAAARREGQPWT